MRKAYGPTDISFHYPFEAFKSDIAQGRNFKVELVLDGECYYPTFDLAYIADNDTSLRVLFNKIDNMSIQRNGIALLQLLT